MARWQPIAWYFLVALALSWGFWVPMAIRGREIERGGPFHFPGLLGPMVAALAVTALVCGRPGLVDLARRVFRWRVPLRWYAVAFSPFLFFALTAAIVAVFGGEWPSWSDLGRFGGFPIWGGPLGLFLLLTVINGFGEEVGWRGFAVPHLQRHFSPLRTALLIAPIWILWHGPNLWFNPGYQTPLVIIGLLTGIPAGSIFLTSLYNRTGGSVLMVTLWHGSYNLVAASDAAEGILGAVVSVAVTIWGVALGIDEVRARRRGHPGPVSVARSGPPDSVNALVGWLLRSRFHGLLSRSLLLITVTGRRSGRPFTFPVQYVESGDELVILPGHPARKRWWRNLVGGAPVQLVLRGVRREAWAEAFEAGEQPTTVRVRPTDGLGERVAEPARPATV